MLSSVAEGEALVRRDAVTFLKPDAPRIGGVTPFLKIAAVAELARLKLAPHVVMESHVHLACAYPHESWMEHIAWPEPAFEERLELRDGRMVLPDRPGLGFTLSERGCAGRVAGEGVGSVGCGDGAALR